MSGSPKIARSEQRSGGRSPSRARERSGIEGTRDQETR